MINEDQVQAFDRLSRNKDMSVVLLYLEDKLAEICDVRRITSPEAIESTKIAANFIQNELLNRFKRYSTRDNSNNDDISYL